MRSTLLSVLLIALCAPIPALAKHVHLVSFTCEGKPDRLVGKQNGIYFACVGGKVTCSKDGLIPQSWMDQHDADIEQLKADTAHLREDFKRYRQEARDLSPRERHERAIARSRARRDARSSGSTARPTQIRSLSADTAPVPSKSSPVDPAALAALPLGSTDDEVIDAVGLPRMKLAGGTGEKWTYKLTNGKSAKLQFNDGKLAGMDLP